MLDQYRSAFSDNNTSLLSYTHHTYACTYTHTSLSSLSLLSLFSLSSLSSLFYLPWWCAACCGRGPLGMALYTHSKRGYPYGRDRETRASRKLETGKRRASNGQAVGKQAFLGASIENVIFWDTDMQRHGMITILRAGQQEQHSFQECPTEAPRRASSARRVFLL